MFGCIYPDMCIAYNITSSDRSIEHYLQTLYSSNRNYSAILATLQITSYVHSRNSS